jgi:hypothetical protein
VSALHVQDTYRTCSLRNNLDTVSVFVAFTSRVLTPSKASKESSVKRRQLIDGINYHFNIQFKKYKAEHHRAEREDSWTRSIISKVQCAWFISLFAQGLTCRVHSPSW